MTSTFYALRRCHRRGRHWRFDAHGQRSPARRPSDRRRRLLRDASGAKKTYQLDAAASCSGTYNETASTRASSAAARRLYLDRLHPHLRDASPCPHAQVSVCYLLAVPYPPMSVPATKPRGRTFARGTKWTSEEQEVDVRKYFQRIVRYWWLPVASFVIGGRCSGFLLRNGWRSRSTRRRRPCRSRGHAVHARRHGAGSGAIRDDARVRHARTCMPRGRDPGRVANPERHEGRGQVRNGVSTQLVQTPRKGTTGAADSSTPGIYRQRAERRQGVARAANRP